MKNNNNDFLEYILDILSPLGEITHKSMFGGFGFYKNGLIFAIIANGELYFKGGLEEADSFYENEGSSKFGYEGKGKIVTMSYWKVLPDVFEDEELLSKWFEYAYTCSMASKKKPKNTPKNTRPKNKNK